MAESRHAAVVSEWMERALAGRAPREVVPLFGAALLAIWDRAHVTLGEVTLRAIMQRVLLGARARFAVLRSLGIEATPLSFRGLIEQDGAPNADRAELVAAMQFVLSEVLSLLGTLTADILTNALHDALRSVELPAAAQAKPMTSNRGVPS